jgi:hypothetical protein
MDRNNASERKGVIYLLGGLIILAIIIYILPGKIADLQTKRYGQLVTVNLIEVTHRNLKLKPMVAFEYEGQIYRTQKINIKDLESLSFGYKFQVYHRPNSDIFISKSFNVTSELTYGAITIMIALLYIVQGVRKIRQRSD